MRGPLADIVLLSLVVVFFAVEQRRRPELYFRFWLAGWLMVLFSNVCSAVSFRSWMPEVWLTCIRQDALVCGGLAFLFSFQVSGRKWRLPVLCAVALGSVICLELDLIVAGSPPPWWMVLLIVGGEILSLSMAYTFLVRGRIWFFPLMALVVAICGAGMIYTATHRLPGDVIDFILAQLFLVCGLMIARSKYRGGRLAGSIGFFAWGCCYVLGTDLYPSAAVLKVVQGIWTIPKYFVGFGMILQIFERAHNEIERLNTQHQRLYGEYRMLFQSNPHPMWIYEIASQRFLSVNDAAVRCYGYTEEAFLGMAVTCLFAERSTDCGMGETDRTDAYEKRPARQRRADTTEFDVDLTEQEITFAGKEARLVLAVDVTEREELHRELIRRAHHDALTGLPNRMMLDDRIQQCLSRCDRESDKGALLTVDIDHFKRVNDTFGHPAGDECLREAANRLRSRVRLTDTIARTGGEEFMIVVGGLTDRRGAETICAELLRMFEAPFLIGDRRLKVTVSIGVALYPDDANNIEGLRRISDQALYEAKRLGRNQAAFAAAIAERSPSLAQQAADEAALSR